MEGRSTDQVVERAGGASPQLDEEQVQPMDVSLDQSATTGAAKRRAETPLTPHSGEGCIGGLRSFDGYQAEQPQLMLAIEVAKDEFSVDTIDDDRRRYDYSSGKLLDRDKYIAGGKKELNQMEAFGVIRRVKKSEATDGTHVRMKVIASEKGDLVRWRLVSMEFNQYERHDAFAGTPALKVFRMLIAKAASHRDTEHGNRKVIAILDAAVEFFM